MMDRCSPARPEATPARASLGRLDEFKVGDTVRVSVQRNGTQVEIPVTLQPGQ